jgi:hypothetical protein
LAAESIAGGSANPVIALQNDDRSFYVLADHSPVTWELLREGTEFVAEELTYTDTANKVIGPLTNTPSNAIMSNLFPATGVIQTYTTDYTVRQVTGGSAPGYYVCIATGSTAPGGGSFSGGSNPATGIDSVMVNGDKVRVLYPS